jgi:hypothetical protein
VWGCRVWWCGCVVGVGGVGDVGVWWVWVV